jgi:aminoglycoside 3-N-acetyltransferase
MRELDEPITRERLAADLRAMGVERGSMLYVGGNCREIGSLTPPFNETLIGGLVDAVGESGTIVVPAFTRLNLRWAKKKATFTPTSRSYAGRLAHAALAHPGHVRSTHPSHSFVAIGKDALSLLADHDETRLAHEPIRKLVDADAPGIFIGCNGAGNGFSTAHLAQQDLGLSRRHYTKLLYEAWILRDGRQICWRPREDPGCSQGFHKLYGHYLQDRNLSTGYIGNAFTLRVRLRQAYAVDLAVLSRDPLAVLCDDKACVSCRILRGYNLRAALPALLRRLWRRSRGTHRMQATAD